MSELLVIECMCGSTTSAFRRDLRRHPGSTIRCKAILKNGKVCGRVIKVDALLRLPWDQNIYIVVPEQEELQLR